MKKDRFSFGPQGWAMLTLVVGAALASPFLRAPKPGERLPVDSQIAAGAVDDDGSIRNPHAGPMAGRVRVVAGQLPNTSFAGSGEVTMPDWARRQSKLDDIIAQGKVAPAPGIAGEQVDDDGSSREAMRPWTTQPGTSSRGADGGSNGPAAQRRQFGRQAIANLGQSHPQVPASPWQQSTTEQSQTHSPTAGSYANQWSDPAELRQLAAVAARDEGPQSAANRAGNLVGASLSKTKPAAREQEPVLPARVPQFVYQPGVQP